MDNRRMEVVNLLESEQKEHWLEQIDRSDWRAGPYLARLIRGGRFFAEMGAKSRVLLLVEGDALVSYCTYSEKDNIRPTELTPWMGFVYTFPAWRGRRCAGKLVEEIGRLAKKEGVSRVYLSTDHVGLYEKYGFRYLTTLDDVDGKPSRVYARDFG